MMRYNELDQRRAPPPPMAVAADKPRVIQQLDQLEKVLDACYQVANSVQSAADRITGPTPQGSDGAAGQLTGSSMTVEHRLGMLVATAERVHARLVDTNNQLNGAV